MIDDAGFDAERLPPVRRHDRGIAHGDGSMSATLEAVRAAPGLAEYLAEVEDLLEQSVAGHPGLVADVGAEALTAGGKRLRPMLTFLSAPAGARALGRRGCSGGARPHGDARPRRPDRRRAGASRPGGGLDGVRRRGRAGGGRLHLRARVRRARGLRSTWTPSRCSPKHRSALARGEALQRRQRHDPDTTVDGYLERCALKTGKLFEAACVLGGGSGDYGTLLGVSFQIVDDILDCAGDTIETGKIPGTDLRDGTPTLPLLLAAREDEVVRAALAGGSLEGVARARGCDGRLGALPRGGPRLR